MNAPQKAVLLCGGVFYFGLILVMLGLGARGVGYAAVGGLALLAGVIYLLRSKSVTSPDGGP